MLIQIYLAIGFNGDIVPNTTHYDKLHVGVGNVTKIMMRAISSVLNCYFAVQASPMTEGRIDDIRRQLVMMYRHFIAFYQLMHKFCDLPGDKLPGSRKLHAIVCNITSFLKGFGAIDKGDTASYESVHRAMTVGVWHNTSKRVSTMNTEMAKQSLLHNYNTFNDFLYAFTTDEMGTFIRDRGPPQHPDEVEYSRMNNMPAISITYNAHNDVLSDEDATYHAILQSAKNTNDEVSLDFKSYEDAWESLRRGSNTLLLVQGISIHGNEESKLGKIHLYATHSFHGKSSRYDYVVIQLDQGAVQPAQLLLLFEMTNSRTQEITYYAHVRYLQLVTRITDVPSKSYLCPFQMYEWEYQYSGGRGNRGRKKYVTQVVDIGTIIGPAFITAVKDKSKTDPTFSTPKWTDRFWLIDRKFCDRSGWDDIFHNNNILLDDGDDVDLNVVYASDDEDLENIDSNSDNDDDDN